MFKLRLLIATLLTGIFSSLALADGMIVPVRPEIRVSGSWAVKYHHVNITVRDQVASVAIDQEFINTGHGMIEVEYLFPVPPDAAIDSMTLVVNGKEFAAQLLKADEARRIYEDIVRKKKDPALLEYVGFGLIKTRAFPLEPGKPAKVLVTYKNVCKKDNNLVGVWYPLNTEKFSAKPIEDVEVRVDIKDKADITAVYSPTHDLAVERKDPRHVIASFKARDTIPTTDFQVLYKSADEEVGATLLTAQPDSKKDGYFMMLVSPNPRSAKGAVVAKDVLVVFDHSGSMSGQKLDQAKDALRFILKNLNKADRFNIIAYSDDVEPFFDKLMPVSDKNIEEAMERLDRVEATGGTNIDEALLTAMKMLPNWQFQHLPATKGTPAPWERIPDKTPKYVIFLTDGQPTVGKTHEEEILQDVKKANACNARVFAFGVGYDVNVKLLDKLVRQNSGRSDYVKPKEPVEAKISSLYTKIKNPVMTGIKVSIDGLRLRDMYPREVGDLFEGDQIVLVGRYFGEDVEKLNRGGEGKSHTNIVVKGTYEGRERAFEYPATVNAAGRDSRYAFVEKLWAIRRVGFLLDEIQLHGENKEIVDELVRLSKDYGIMTPYTAFLADERTPLARPAEVHMRAMAEAKDLSGVSDGASGQMAAKMRGELNDAARAPSPGGAYGGSGGTLAGSQARAGTVVIGGRDQFDYESGNKKVLANVRQVGNQAVYQRGNIWIASNATHIDPDRDAAKIKQVQRFSDEYFKLVSANTAAENQILASQQEHEELLVELRGTVYQIK